VCGSTNLDEVPEAKDEGLGSVRDPLAGAHLRQRLGRRLEAEDDGAILDLAVALENAGEGLASVDVEHKNGAIRCPECDALVLGITVAVGLEHVGDR
jgi:hypothetical protein